MKKLFLSIVFFSLLMVGCTEDYSDPKSISNTTWRCSNFSGNILEKDYDYIDVHFLTSNKVEFVFKSGSETDTSGGWSYSLSNGKLKIYETEDPDDDDGEYSTGVFNNNTLTLTWAPGTTEEETMVFVKQ